MIVPDTDMTNGRYCLPKYRYWPGVNARPDPSSLAALHETSRSLQATWCFGLYLFDSGYYWEAHEVLESVWHHSAPNSRERALVQAVIQIANAALKHCRGAEAARDRILLRARSAAARVWPASRQDTCVLGVPRAALLWLLHAEHWVAPPGSPPMGTWCGVLPGAGLQAYCSVKNTSKLSE